MTTYYTVTGNPPNQTRGTSSTVRAEFALIAAGFTSAATDIATLTSTKGAITGQTWTGTHQFPATTYGVTAAFGATGTAFATLDYVNAVATNAALPGQTGNAGKFLTTNGTTASWGQPLPTLALGFLRSDGATNSFTQTHTGYAVNEVKGADIASAATINLTTATGNFVHITGTTTITGITIPVGAERTVVFDGALTLTHGAGLLLPGAANITTAAGDRMIVRGDTSGAVVVGYGRANGHGVVETTYALTLVATLTPTVAANVDFLNTFTSTYDNYLIVLDGIKPGSTDDLYLRIAVGGAADATSANYYPAGGTTASYVAIASSVQSTGGGVSTMIHIFNANSASSVQSILVKGHVQRGAGSNAASLDVSEAHFNGIASGIRLFWNAGANFAATGKVRVYGYQNS